jgi:ATP-dependent Lhr-like helicase
MAERVTHHLSELLGADAVTSHHGSLSAKTASRCRRPIEARRLEALVATASLELGIDIGSVDLVCQLATTRSIATLSATRRSCRTTKRRWFAEGRIFPLSRDELGRVRGAAALGRAVMLDRFVIPEKPLDVLAQQIVAPLD